MYRGGPICYVVSREPLYWFRDFLLSPFDLRLEKQIFAMLSLSISVSTCSWWYQQFMCDTCGAQTRIRSWNKFTLSFSIFKKQTKFSCKRVVLHLRLHAFCWLRIYVFQKLVLRFTLACAVHIVRCGFEKWWRYKEPFSFSLCFKT